MADIIDISTRFKKAPSAPTLQELVDFAVDDINSNWQKFASNNRLNDYFISCTAMWCRGGVNYLEDLNALSVIEQKITLEPQVIAPGFGVDNPLGWVAAFRLNGQIFATPFMMNEAYARAFNVLLFLKLRRDMSTNKIPIL